MIEGAGLHIIHLALGGCLRSPPVSYGVTADTGGHIAYVLEAAAAHAARDDVDEVDIVTRLFEDAALDAEHSVSRVALGAKLAIVRLATADRRYLEKEALAADLPAFIEAFCAYLEGLPRLPDVIHAHFADAAAVAGEARRRYSIPFVYTPHALGIDKRDAAGRSPALDMRIASEAAAIAEADALVVSSADEAERQIAAYGIADTEYRTLCVPPGIPHRSALTTGMALADRLPEWLKNPALPILLVVARPVAKKNIAALLRGYAGCAALQRTANVVILAGQHDAHCSAEEHTVLRELRGLAAQPALAGRVALPPQHTAADVQALFALAADGGVFVNPALHEPFGLTILEAAAAGVPVVATRCGGPAEIVGKVGHGVLIDPRDPSAIAAACLRLVEDRALHARLAGAGRLGVRDYDWARYAAATVERSAALRPKPALLACDIDGTLTGCAAGAAQFTRWSKCRDLPFIVATGRRFEEARAIIEQWQLPEPDAYLTDVGSTMMLRTTGGAWRRCSDHDAALEANWNADAVGRVMRQLGVVFQPPAYQGRHKQSAFGSAAQAAAIRCALGGQGLKATVIHSHGHLIDVLPAQGGKATAVGRYARRLGATLAGCIVAGDSGNDADMLSRAGRAIVVGNADSDLGALRPRRGLYRARQRHAGGVMEGLRAHGVAREEIAA